MTRFHATASDGSCFRAPDITEDGIEAVVWMVRSGWITTGAECDRLESVLSDFLGGGTQVVALSSLTAALEIAAEYYGLSAGQRVGMPTWTFASSATAVLLDGDPDTFNVDLVSLRGALDDGGIEAFRRPPADRAPLS